MYAFQRSSSVVRWLVCGMSLAATLAAGAEPSEPIEPTVEYMMVVTGGELLSGAYADSHTRFVTRTLRPLGFRCLGSMSVDDKRDDIQAALRFASARVGLVIVTGGLGPTDGDITRETLSDYTGVALKEHPAVLTELERRFNTPRGQLRGNLRRQTRVPSRGGYLNNPNGTAVGLVFERELEQELEQARSVIVALPGPPRELRPMVRDELVPYLSRRFGTRLPGAALTLRFVGVGQSRIQQTFEEHAVLPPDVMCFLAVPGRPRRLYFFPVRQHVRRPDGTRRSEAQSAPILGRLCVRGGPNIVRVPHCRIVGSARLDHRPR